MNVLLVILFVLMILVAVFCLWVLAKISSLASNKEEQMAIERKLRESNEKRKFKNNKR